MKRTARLLVNTVLCAVILAQLAYIGRGVFERQIRGEIASALADITGSAVSVGTIGGNWLNHVIIHDVELTGGPDSFLQEVRGLRLELWFSVADLLSGDLGGLRACRVTAGSVRARIDGGFPGEPSNPGGEPDPMDELLRILPGGAAVKIGDFSFGVPEAQHSGALTMFLQPGTGDRDLRIEHAGLSAEMTLRREEAGISAHTMAHVEDPGHVLRSLGVPNEFQGGELGMSCGVTIQPFEGSGHLELSGARYLDREIATSRVIWELDREQLRVREGDLQLAGVRIHTGGLLAPNPLESPALPLEAFSGDLDLDITDLSPYAELVPELQEWLPVRGRLRAWMEGGRAHLAEAWLQAEGVTLQLDRGTLELAPLVAGESTGSEEQGFELVVSTPRSWPIEDLGELRTSGSLRGTVSGSLAEPRVQVRADLGPTTLGDLRCERLSGSIAYAGDHASLTDLRLYELEALDSTVLSRLQGSAELGIDSLDGDNLVVALQGQAGQEWLNLLHVSDPTLHDMTPPEFTLTGQMTMGGDLPIGNVELSLTGMEIPPDAPGELSASLALDSSGVLQIERLTLRGPATLDLDATVPLRGGPIVASLHAPEQDLGFPTSFLPEGHGLKGTFALDLEARGEPTDLSLDVDLSALLQDPVSGLDDWPVHLLGPVPPGPVRIELLASQSSGGIDVERLLLDSGSAHVTGQGSVPLRWHPDAGLTAVASDGSLDLDLEVSTSGPEGMDLPIDAKGRMTIGRQTTRIEDLHISAGPGRATGHISTEAGWAEWLFGDPGGRDLRGELALEDMSLEILPAQELGLNGLQGNLSGHASLGGTIDRPRPRVDLDVSGAALRANGLTRLENLSAHISATPDEIRLDNLSGTMGAGPFGGEVVLTAGNGDLPDSLSESSITGSIWGKDLLLANERDLRVRGHVDVSMTGSVEDLSVQGTVRITTGRYVRRMTLLPDLRARGGATAALGDFRLLPLDSPLGQRIRLDVRITTARDFEVRTHVLDCDLGCDLRLRGQASLTRLEGIVSSSVGVLRFPGTTLRLDSALVTFPTDGSSQPELIANASGRRHGVQIQINAHGPLQEPEVLVTSIPALPPGELWTLVTTGALPQTLRSQGLEGQAALVGGYLAEELAAWYVGDNLEDTTSFLDRFSFIAGRDISNSGQESLVVEFSLSELLHLQGERDVYEDYNGGIVLRWRF